MGTRTRVTGEALRGGTGRGAGPVKGKASVRYRTVLLAAAAAALLQASAPARAEEIRFFAGLVDTRASGGHNLYVKCEHLIKIHVESQCGHFGGTAEQFIQLNGQQVRLWTESAALGAYACAAYKHRDAAGFCSELAGPPAEFDVCRTPGGVPEHVYLTWKGDHFDVHGSPTEVKPFKDSLKVCG